MAKTILAIDDSRTMRDMVSHTLSGAGFTVLTAEDGKIGLEVLAANKVDVIITDLNMPELDGFGVIEGALANPKYKYTPILMLTTESDQAKKDRGKAMGATGWIVKPFNPEKLVQIINKVCP
jgi:two-component system chemotaxis response regulator CheY